MTDQANPTSYWTVSTSTGKIKGHAETGVAAFRGIPYAEPPVGERRFRRAQPITPWQGTFDARTSGEYCYQFRNKAVGWIGSEDCLWLNVVVPQVDPSPTQSHAIDPDAKRPIAVHLHGGSNIHGSAADPVRSGEYFACATDSIFVGVNYRVGIFGQLFLGEGADDDRFDSNAGLSDILVALRWIKDNARTFGGDPDRITIFGESSGGAMVTSLIASPYLEGLVAGAIAESPAGAMIHSRQDAAQWRDQAMAILERMRSSEQEGVASEKLDVADLLTASAQELGQLTEELTAANSTTNPKLAGAFAPLVDGDILPFHPLQEGVQLDLPLMIGYNRDEYQFMRFEKRRTKEQRERTVNVANNIAGDAANQLVQQYGSGKSRLDNAEFMSHVLFVAPVYAIAENHPNDNIWLYRLDLTTPALNLTGFGATHALDLPLLFQRVDNDRGKLALALGGRSIMQSTSQAMQQRWKNFIHDQDPGFPAFSSTATGTAGSEDSGADATPKPGTMQIFDGKAFPEGERSMPAPLSDRRLAWQEVSLLFDEY